MKKTLSMITLAVLSVGLLGSCLKINERLDNLDKRVDVIENEKIATINGQIDGIKSSIADLGQIRSDISNLKQTAEAHGEDIFALQEADETLGNRIDNLEDYLDNVLPTFAEKEWVEATYSTLEQYDSTCTAIAEINVRIGELDTRLSKDIKDCADSLTKWINVKFEGYYTAAEMDAKLAQMKAAIDSAKAAGRITDAKADSIAAELTKTKTAVDTAKSNIRKEYKAAIKTAIDSTEGKLTKKIQDEIEKVNDRIDLLAGQVTNLNNAVIALAVRVDALEKMIQSVTIVPAYSDGSVKVEDNTLFIDFTVTPKEAVANLQKGSVRILLNKVQSKAVILDTVPTDNIKFFKTYKENGTVSIKAYIKETLAEDNYSLSVAVNVKKDKSDYTSEFVPVALPVSVSLNHKSIYVPFSSAGSDTTLTATVKNSTKGVFWTSTGHCTSVDEMGKVSIKNDAVGKDIIVVRTKEGNAKDTCLVIVGALPGEFTVNAQGKKVHFSQGNLYCKRTSSGSTDWTWHFYEEQNKFYQLDMNVSGQVVDDWNCQREIEETELEIHLFTWGYNATNSVNPTGTDYVTGHTTDGEPFDKTEDWGYVFGGESSVWRTLSKDEWNYLLTIRTVNGGQGENKSYSYTKYGNQKGLVIYPDNYTGPALPAEVETLPEGVAFLPYAGGRVHTGTSYGQWDGTKVRFVGLNGFYWSSSAESANFKYMVNLYYHQYNPDSPAFGHSVRLVTEVPAE